MAGRKLTQDEVIQQIKLVHGEKYSFEKFVYGGTHIKSIVTCTKHGDFTISPSHLKQGKGCKKCSVESKTLTQYEVIEQIKLIHCEKYSFEKFVYIGNKNKSIVTCPVHGDFTISPNHLKRGQGCKKCAVESRTINRTLTQYEVIEQIKLIHGEKYSFEKFVYTGSQNKSIVTCYIHGDFITTPDVLKKGSVCKKCSVESKTLTQYEVIEQIKLIHGEKYSFEKFVYTGSQNKSIVTCPVHGDFITKPNYLKKGHGCSGCAKYGFDSSKEGSFYIQKLFDNNTFIGVKIGITNKKPEQRMRQQSNRSIYRHELFTNIRDSGIIVRELERRLKKKFTKFRANILRESMEDGWTETYSKESLFYIVPYIDEQYNLLKEKAVN